MAEYVMATPIDTDVLSQTETERWLANLGERASEACAQYGDPDSLGKPERKAARAYYNRTIKEMESERAARVKSVKEAIRAFESEANASIEPLRERAREFDAAVKADDVEWRERRRAEIADMLAEMAPYLVERVDVETGEIHDAIVDLDTLIARYGCEKGSAWMNRTNIQIVRMSLQNAVYDIREGEKAIDSMVAEEDVEEAKARYFATLDLDGTLRDMRAVAEQRERVRALELQRALDAPMANPRPEVEANPQPEVEGPADASPYTIELPPVTREQMVELAAYLNSVGITGGTIYRGTVEDAMRKKVANG